MNGVLETYELLENIIASLPINTIFVVSSTSKVWQHVIARSNRIKRLIFKKPTGPPLQPIDILRSEDRTITYPEYNQELIINRVSFGRISASRWRPDASRTGSLQYRILQQTPLCKINSLHAEHRYVFSLSYCHVRRTLTILNAPRHGYVSHEATVYRCRHDR